MSWFVVAACLQPVDLEVEVRAASVHPKFRLRDGETSLKGESIFSRELDAEDEVFSPGLELRARWDRHVIHASFWQLTAEGGGRLDEDKNWGGAVVPAGTPTDAEVLFRHAELGWRFRLVGMDELWVDAGASLEYMVVDADLGFGKTRLGGVFPTPQLAVTYAPWPWLELTAEAGGFFLPFRTGDTSELDPIEYTAAVRGRWDRYSVALGYDLYHVHLEENSGDTEEDLVHLRLRGVFLSLEARF